MTAKAVSCPVCKIFLKKEESLHDHLNTHPKEQVIEALIQLKDACKIFNPSGSVGESSSPITCDGNSSQEPEENFEVAPYDPVESDQDQDETEVEETTTSASPPQYALPLCVPSSSSGHIIPFSPYIAGSSSVAQFIHVPVVTSTVQNQVAPTPDQAPVVLYTPFVCPPSSSESVINPPQNLNSTRHLQFLTNNNLVRSSFSIIQTCPNQEVPQVAPIPISQPFSGVKVEGSPGHIILMHANHNRATAQEYTTAAFSPEQQDQDQNIDECSSPLELTIKQDHQFNDSEGGDDRGSGASLNAQISICDSQQIPPVDPLDVSNPLDPLDCRTSQECEMLSPPKKRKCPEWKSPSAPVDHSVKYPVEIPSKTFTSSCVEGVLRLRSDLSVTARNVDAKSDIWPIELPKIPLKREAQNSHDYYDESSPARGSNYYTKEVEECNSAESTCIDPSDFLVTQLEAPVKEADYQDDNSVGQPSTPPCESGPPSPYEKSLDSPTTPLNIQTDETMPPRGELSEQESIGGNSSSMWSVPTYNTSRELPSPVVSYDLTARESWPGSEISDSEGNTSAPAQHFTTPPSFTNTLHPFIAKPPTEAPFSSRLKPQAVVDSHETNKAPCSTGDTSKNSANDNAPSSRIKKVPTKPRVYRCKECSLVFTSLKLRRMHPCEQMNSTNNSLTITVMKMTPDLKALNEENFSMPGSSRQDEGLDIQSKPKRKNPRKPKATIKKEMIVDDQMSGQTNFSAQYRISKSEPEETAESRYNSQLLVASQVTKSEESSTFVSVTSNEAPSIDKVSIMQEAIQSVNENEHTCERCGQNLANAKILSQHMSSKHKGQKYQCTTCGESFEKEREYYDHLMIHPLECQECGKTFTRRKYLVLHMKRHMEVKPHKCETCNKSFVTKQKLDEHQNTHTGNAPIKCPDCDKSFRRYSNLIQHRNRYHLKIKPKVKDFICHCGEVFSSKKKLEWHKEIHDDKPKSCQYCSEKFVHTVSLTRHVRRTHDRRYVPMKGREGENIECPVCRLVFLKSSLATHIKIHSGERPYPCHICGKDFTTKWNLQLHRWTHASRSTRPFKCTLCKAAFYRKQDYHSHMHSHRNFRPFTCNFCGCQFLRKYNCIRHMREHEEGKNFTCTICNKTFHRRYYLKDHMRVHSGTRPFTCHICGKSSTSKSNHNKHVRIHHAREPQNAEI